MAAGEPWKRSLHFSAAVDRQLCVYGGDLGCGGSELPSTVHVFSCDAEEWRSAATTGTHPPPNLCHGACTSKDHLVFVHGGWDKEKHFNNLYRLDCRYLQWTQLSSAGDHCAPMAKRGHGMIYFEQTSSLVVFGGYGPIPSGPTQPGAEYQNVNGNEVRTNELHVFQLQEGKWFYPEVTGRRPPPCEDFTLTLVDYYRAVLFGGYEGGRVYFKHLYVLDIDTMCWSQVDDDSRTPWPDVRYGHAAVCLGFGQDYPHLLITDGWDGFNSLNDAWALDLRSWKWKEVKSLSLKPRRHHSATAFNISQEVIEVIMFGGLFKTELSDTTVVRFEWLKRHSRNECHSAEWIVTDIAVGSQLKTKLRVTEKEAILTAAGEERFLKTINNILAKDDNISRKLAHCVITGPTGSGKSSLLMRLLQKRLENFSKSTGIIESTVFVDMNEINLTTFHSAAAVDYDVWKEVDYELSLVSQLGQNSQVKVTADTQSQADSKSSDSIHTKLLAEKANSKAQGIVSKFVQLFKGKVENENYIPPTHHLRHGSFSVIAVSSESVLSVIRKYGFKTFQDYLKKTSSLYLRDTGGQVEFQEMLPLFIFGPSIFLFVFRADVDIRSKLSFQYRESEDRTLNYYTSSISTEDALLQFLASVYAMDTSGKDIIKTHKSLVFIVGSHVDRLGSSADQTIERLNRQIDSVIKMNGFRDLVQYADESRGSVIFPVDNTSDSDKNFSVIRSKINSLVSHREEFTIEYPTSFLLFCLDLQKVNKAIISLDEFKTLAAQHNIMGEQVFTLLYFLHLRVGVIRYFNVDGLRDIVVLEPQVLFNTVTTLIVKTFSSEVLPSREVLEYKEKGFLLASAFECVVRSRREYEMKRGIVPASAFETISIDCDLNPQKFLQLLVQLRIIAPLPTEKDQEKKYFIPCVLNHILESDHKDFPPTCVLPLAVKFQCQHCPKGVFGVLVTHLMTSEASQKEVTFTLMQDKIYKDQVFFMVHSTDIRDTISLKVYSSHLEIKFFPGSLEDRDEPVSTTCQKVREAIEGFIKKSLIDLHYSKDKLEPSMCFKCTQTNCSKFHSIFKGKVVYKIYCDRTGKTCRLPLQGRCWFNEGEPLPDSDSTSSIIAGSPGKTNQLKVASADFAVMPGVVSHPLCLTVADHYAVTRHLRDLSNEDVLELGEALGLYYPHLRKMDRLLKDMVAAWLNKEDNVLSISGIPSWATLIEALLEINQPGIAQKIKEGPCKTLSRQSQPNGSSPQDSTIVPALQPSFQLPAEQKDNLNMGAVDTSGYSAYQTLMEHMMYKWK